MERLQLYITASHASVTVVNGASRETSARSVSQMIDAMCKEDGETLYLFCQAVTRYMQEHIPAKSLDTLVISQ